MTFTGGITFEGGIYPSTTPPPPFLDYSLLRRIIGVEVDLLEEKIHINDG